MKYENLPDSVKRGDIVDYETDDGGAVPMLVIHVNDQENGDGAVIGHVFDVDGSTRTVTLRHEEEAPQAAPQRSLQAQLGDLSPSERAALLADLGIQVSGQTNPPANPPAETPEPAPAVQEPAGAPAQNGVSE